MKWPVFPRVFSILGGPDKPELLFPKRARRRRRFAAQGGGVAGGEGQRTQAPGGRPDGRGPPSARSPGRRLDRHRGEAPAVAGPGRHRRGRARAGATDYGRPERRAEDQRQRTELVRLGAAKAALGTASWALSGGPSGAPEGWRRVAPGAADLESGPGRARRAPPGLELRRPRGGSRPRPALHVLQLL